MQEYKQSCAIEIRSQERNSDQILRNKNHNLTLKLKELERSIAAHVAEVDQDCRREQSKQEIQQNELA